MKITRTFYPVGQGAFYCEDHDGRVIVYDCGSQNRTLIEPQACAFAEQNQKIEAIFISHLHMDHVNGLPALLQNCQVERVFLPLLNDVEKANCYLTVIYKQHNFGYTLHGRFSLSVEGKFVFFHYYNRRVAFSITGLC